MRNISYWRTNISTQAMKLLYLPRSPCSLLVLLLFFSCSSFSLAADSAPALAVRQDGAFLYSRQDEYSDKIATLQKGEALTPLAEAVGKETWYFVQTKQGLSGWVRAADVSLSEQLKQAFKEEPQSSTWRARASNGRTFEGTWTVEPGTSPDKASGAWTLSEGPTKTVARGAWAAQKFSTGWSGTWRAFRRRSKDGILRQLDSGLYLKRVNYVLLNFRSRRPRGDPRRLERGNQFRQLVHPRGEMRR